MRKKMLLLALLLTVCLASAFSNPIKLKVRRTFQPRGMRLPPVTMVCADYDNEEVVIDISHYEGSVQTYLLDSNGNIVGYDSFEFMDGGSLTIEVGNLPNGDYTLSVVLGDATYYGEFQVTA